MATVGPLTAAPYVPAQAVDSTDGEPKPLIVPAPHRGQDRNFDGFGKAPATEPLAEYRQAVFGNVAIERPALGPSIRGQSEAVNTAGWVPSQSPVATNFLHGQFPSRN